MESTETPRAFEKAYAAHGEKILAYLRRLTRDPGIAGDLAQEIFLRVSRGLAKFRGESRLSTWIYRIATNVFLDYVRAPGSRRAEERPFDAP
ncbi:MAG: sigma-70 family RNA polymerase sigma factor, partial [Myxococcota bacterium]